MTFAEIPPAPGPADLARDPHPLRGRVALVTGASRRRGIGYAVARRLTAYGAEVFLHHHQPHDQEQPWGADDLDAVRDGVAEEALPGVRITRTGTDLALPHGPRHLFAAATAEFGHIDILVCNHARSGSDGTLDHIDAEMLDAHWSTNARSSLLLAKEFSAHHDGREGGRIIFLTSGQTLRTMPDEIAYATSKAALAGITRSLAAHLAPCGILVNTVNPGPVQTGYITEEAWQRMRPLFPRDRLGAPDDPARLICWLATDEARWITGEVISTEGGFAM